MRRAPEIREPTSPAAAPPAGVRSLNREPATDGPTTEHRSEQMSAPRDGTSQLRISTIPFAASSSQRHGPVETAIPRARSCWASVARALQERGTPRGKSRPLRPHFPFVAARRNKRGRGDARSRDATRQHRDGDGRRGEFQHPTGRKTGKWEESLLSQELLINLPLPKPIRLDHQTEIWCAWQDLNLHAFRHYHLKVACLPIPPHAQPGAYSINSFRGAQEHFIFTWLLPAIRMGNYFALLHGNSVN